MKLRGRWLLLSGLFMAAMAMLLAGCGSGKGATSGSLELDDITVETFSPGVVAVKSKATYKPATGEVLPYTLIEYTALIKKGDAVIGKKTAKIQSGNDFGPFPVYQDDSNLTVVITAEYGGHKTSKIASIPAITPFVVTPESVEFTDEDPVNKTVMINIVGGRSPYSISSDRPADIEATVDSYSASIIKKYLNTGEATSATVTVTDARGTNQYITVSY